MSGSGTCTRRCSPIDAASSISRPKARSPFCSALMKRSANMLATVQTRLFYSPNFSEKWFEKMARDDRENWRKRLLGQNRIHRVIVDKVTAHDLVNVHP